VHVHAQMFVIINFVLSLYWHFFSLNRADGRRNGIWVDCAFLAWPPSPSSESETLLELWSVRIQFVASARYKPLIFWSCINSFLTHNNVV
jgi:hypothetical protein